MTKVKNIILMQAAASTLCLILLLLLVSCAKRDSGKTGASPQMTWGPEGTMLKDSAGYAAGYIWELKQPSQGMYMLATIREGVCRVTAYQVEAGLNKLLHLITMEGTWKSVDRHKIAVTMNGGQTPIGWTFSKDFQIMTDQRGNRFTRLSMVSGDQAHEAEVIQTSGSPPAEGIYKNEGSSTTLMVTVTGDRWTCRMEIPPGFGSVYDLSAASPIGGVVRAARLYDRSEKILVGTVDGNYLRIQIGGREVELKRI